MICSECGRENCHTLNCPARPTLKVTAETTQQMLNALAAKTRTVTSLERQLKIAKEFLELNSFHSVLREMENAAKD